VSSSDFDAIDFFRATALYQDPYPYYEYARSHGPVWREPHRGVIMVTGFEEVMSVYNSAEVFSSCNTVAGPWTKFPVPLEGDDISAIIEEHRDSLPFSDQLPSFDPPKHTEQRGLLMRLITPKRLKENEEFMWRLADQQIDEFIARGECEFVRDYANPFTLLVIADLLGVPEEDHPEFLEQLMHSGHLEMTHSPLEYLYAQFTRYIEDRRAEPRDDVMTALATATFPDGSLPPVEDVMKIASNLFAAGQETTARLLGTALQTLAERPDLQQQLRDDRSLVSPFIEETLRLQPPINGTFRLSRTATTVQGTEIPAGSTVMVLPSGANRDPREFEQPDELRLDRENARQHIAFGHGIHTCAGAPLARAESNVSLQRLLDRMADIHISESHHGPASDRHWEYTPTWMLRGHDRLFLQFTPVG
jgi:cytochrome P450 family 150 subfamily A5